MLEDRPCGSCGGQIDYENAPSGLSKRDILLCSGCRTDAVMRSLAEAPGAKERATAVRGYGAESGWQIGGMF